MNCSECQEYLLEADPELLTGIGDEPIAAHIRSCEVCRDLAMAMLSQLQRASLAYARIEPMSQPPRPAVRSIARRVVWAVTSLAAAAAAVLTFHAVGRRGATEDLHGGYWVQLSDATPPSITVSVPDGRNAIVFATKNPLIDIVWIY